MSAEVRIRIPKELKDEMAELEIDWPGFLIEAIELKIAQTRRHNAFRVMDEIREKYKGTDYVMSDEVKKWRQLH